MEYSIYELLFFLFVYSFLGWCLETAYVAVRTGKFRNRGFFSLPLCLSYGFAADLLIILLPTLEGAYLFQAVVYMVITSACAQLADEMSYRVTGTRLWDHEIRSIYSGRLRGLVYTLVMSGVALVVVLLIHPVLFMLLHMLPKLLWHVGVWVLLVLLLLDYAAIYYTAKKKPLSEGMQSLSEEMREQKRNFGNFLSSHIWRRLKKAYPNLQAAEEKTEERATYVFAKGLCLDKLLWVFFISALGGDLIETVYVKLTADVWMSRSSVLYGTFMVSVVLGVVIAGIDWVIRYGLQMLNIVS